MIYKLKYLILSFVAVMSVSSCGLAQLDPEDLPEQATALKLGRDTIDVMVGDSVVLSPTIYPAEAGERMLVWTIEDTNVISFDQQTVTALEQGQTMLYVTSLMDNLTDSCLVRVWETWKEPDVSDKMLYETVVLAKVTVNGKPMSEGMILGAFLDDRLQCFAVAHEDYGVNYHLMRVWNDRMHDPTEYVPEYDNAPPTEHHIITFKLYDSVNKRVYDFPDEIPFDGETHGKLSNLYSLTIKR